MRRVVRFRLKGDHVRDDTSHNGLARLLTEAGENAILRGSDEGKRAILEGWPHSEAMRTSRCVTDYERFRVFRADGFRCRYTGDLLVLPAYLRALSILWPEVVPYHPNWKSDETHEAYWTHTASLEHIAPVAVGGAEAEGNWITTSMARNQVRSRYSLEALGWQVQPRTPLPDWDGGVRAFLALLDTFPSIFASASGAYLMRWQSIVLSTLR